MVTTKEDTPQRKANRRYEEKNKEKRRATCGNFQTMRYILSTLIYIVSLFIYVILSFAIPYLETIIISEALIAFFIGNLMMGVLQPLTYKFGIEKTRYINMIVMVGMGVGFPYFVKAVTSGNINLNFFNSLSPVIISCFTLLLSLIILVISAIISISIYKKKEF